MHAELRDVIDSASSTTGDDEHDPEGATIGFERAQAQALLDRAVRRLTDVEAALARGGDAADCLVCGTPISADRLDALPSTERCIDCARKGGTS